MAKRKTRTSATQKHQEMAEQAVKESASIPDFAYFGDLPIGKTWAFTFSKSAASGLLEQSNYESIKADLEEKFPNDVEEVRSSHWAVGWLDQLAVRMLDDRGKVTPAGVQALEWKEQIEHYPAADEEDYSRREYEATIENIKFTGKLDDTTAGDVYRWLSDNNPNVLESVDDQGGAPSEEDIDEALRALGALPPEEGEEKPPRPYDDPAQMKMFGRRRRA